MPLSKATLKNIKKTEQSLGEGPGRVPYITAAGNAVRYDIWQGVHQTEMCTLISWRSCENADSRLVGRE